MRVKIMSNKEIAECGEKQSVKGSLGSHPFKDVFSKEEAEATKKILVYDKQLGLGGADKHLPNVTFFDDIEKKQPVLSKKLFNSIDLDKDGGLSKKELDHAIDSNIYGKKETSAMVALRKEFRNIDQPKRDGEITAAEIKAFQIGEPFNHKNMKDLTMAKLNANNEYSKVNPKSH
jgi:Ca2+-binding EF-hand superfamily protein